MFFRKEKYFRIGLIAVSFFFFDSSFSQDITEYKKRRFTFHIEKPDTSTSFDVFAVNPNVHANQNASYSWYADGKVLETKGGFSGRLLDGRYVSYYGNKNLRERGIYVNGRKEGKWMKWHSNGKISEVSSWRMGTKQGKYVVSDDMGRKMMSAHFRRDKLNGKVITYDKGAVLLKSKYRNGKEVLPKIPKDKRKSAAAPKSDKPSFFKSLFEKKNKPAKVKPKEDKPGKEKPSKQKKKSELSMSSN